MPDVLILVERCTYLSEIPALDQGDAGLGGTAIREDDIQIIGRHTAFDQIVAGLDVAGGPQRAYQQHETPRFPQHALIDQLLPDTSQAAASLEIDFRRCGAHR